VLPHLAADVSEHSVPVLQLDSEHCVGKRFDHATLDLDGPVFLAHILHNPLNSTGLLLVVCDLLAVTGCY
jgi:hypothetical protein